MVNLDLLTYAGNLDNLTEVSGDPATASPRATSMTAAGGGALCKYEFDTVVNFAAESHVDRSITDPDIF